MKNITQGLMILLFSGAICFSQRINNVQFTDMNGKSYDLYEVLESGKHVLCHFSFNN